MCDHLPNVIIAGVMKSGTTSLFSYLSDHPDVCSSSKKETGYFEGLRYGVELEPLMRYKRYFAHWSGEPIIMEATPGYFEGGKRLACQMQAVLGANLKVIILLRNPISRLQSFIRHKKIWYNSSLDIDRYLDIVETMSYEEKYLPVNHIWYGVEGGKYDRYLTDWFDVYRENVKIIFFDDLKRDPLSVVSAICEWVGIDSAFYHDYSFKIENRSVGFRFATLHKVRTSPLRKLFGKSPFVKEVLMAMYNAINGREFNEALTGKQLARLDKIYEESALKTREILLANGYSSLPVWLSR